MGQCGNVDAGEDVTLRVQEVQAVERTGGGRRGGRRRKVTAALGQRKTFGEEFIQNEASRIKNKT